MRSGCSPTPRSASASGSCVSVRGRLGRPAGALLLYTATLVILLTQSRAGVVAALVVVGLALRLSENWVEAALLALLAVIPAALVAGWAFTRPALVTDGGGDHAQRVTDGSALGVLMVVGAVLVFVLVALVPVGELVANRRKDVVKGLVWTAALLAVVGFLGLVASVGNPVSWARHQLTTHGEVANGPGHLGTLETNNRTVWWGEAWKVFRAHPAGGTGARTFEIARKRIRADAGNVTEPHSVPLQLLSDSGLPGFVFGLALVLGLVLGLRATVRRLEAGERAAAVGLLALPVAFGLHALVDYDLDYLAVLAPTVLVCAALLERDVLSWSLAAAPSGRPRSLSAPSSRCWPSSCLRRRTGRSTRPTGRSTPATSLPLPQLPGTRSG